ncbi:hypothetical protein CgunFtcFv8_003751 [Champsocephalus gunnari]|uniref:Mitochondrial ribosomal protein L1 n=1 Tax=Champsocephalus gunnari TaxID=52237 RepID=A0AAN8E1G5_CHAGU|nr:hypothetical protein CgunFtcFv8_003751 [Champsocephalus gunnari]
MASCSRTVWKVFAGCQRQLLRAGGPAFTGISPTAPRNLPVRTFAAVKPQRKNQKEDKEKEVKKERRVIDDSDRQKPYGFTGWAPVDDVYVPRFYPRTNYGAAESVDMLKTFQRLDFTPLKQPIFIDLRLNMKLEKKKKVDAFISTVHLPHPFKTEMNKVLVFTADANQAQFALESGAVFAGGVELIQPILDDEISADFYITVPDMLQKLVPLKNKLRKKFPKSKRGAVGINILKMLAMFKTGHEYMVEDDCYVRTQIAMLDMTDEQILANLETVLLDVCSQRPAGMEPFIERAIIASQTSEAVWFRSEDLLQKPTEQQQEEEKAVLTI